MSFLRTLADTFSSLLFSSGGGAGAPMDAAAPSPAAVVGERVALKLKGYFELAKEEIDKAVRAEEWGLPDDAAAHYRNALRIMLEAKAARVPDAVSSSERGQVRMYQEKIAKWQTQVEERLRVLGQRGGQGIYSFLVNFLAYASPIVPLSIDPFLCLTVTRIGARDDAIWSSAARLGAGWGGAGGRSQQGRHERPERAQAGGESWSGRANREKKSGREKKGGARNGGASRGGTRNGGASRGGASWKRRSEREKKSGREKKGRHARRRSPWGGLLLFGPPGNGKTMLAKAVASESEATFFNVSASSLTSKWVGEAEKLVRTLFMVAIDKQPSVIFMDEIDSVMSARLANENDASRRLKSEFLIQFDGVSSNPDDLVIVIGATNKPQELDDAVLRRLVKRIYVPLPDQSVRRLLLKNQLKGQAFKLSSKLAIETEGYSGSDLRALCEEAAMMPIRELGPQNILTIKANQLPPLRYEDFKNAMTVIRPSLQKSKWDELEKWNEEFGSS
ncbi:hypothetical protein PR202_ga18290 [Eleusine coracana subsp. coracana]|uniref:microtubule-severing ATPase n=1 Tax=Eleusine coracana subsp. coracana TaxID=191504 RepID=A0AAV5CSC8_ELECO|nr:hypothetical protein PR202_ga18290 [Eleusine coracana subsp. coracana]